MEIVPLTSRPIAEKMASVYAEVVKNLNKARESGLPFKVCPLIYPSLLNSE
jgi:nuclear pore complex protein Nup93